jgi:hypothetical protein
MYFFVRDTILSCTYNRIIIISNLKFESHYRIVSGLHTFICQHHVYFMLTLPPFTLAGFDLTTLKLQIPRKYVSIILVLLFDADS